MCRGLDSNRGHWHFSGEENFMVRIPLETSKVVDPIVICDMLAMNYRNVSLAKFTVIGAHLLVFLSHCIRLTKFVFIASSIYCTLKP